MPPIINSERECLVRFLCGSGADQMCGRGYRFQDQSEYEEYIH